MSLSQEQKQRYSRQIALSEIGIDGQRILQNSKVLVIGAGGIGSPLLLYLVASGIGNIGIVDHDQVDLSNLQRQILLDEVLPIIIDHIADACIVEALLLNKSLPQRYIQQILSKHPEVQIRRA